MKTKSRIECPKAPYKVKNWSQYNKSLTSRGSITIWIPSDCASFWFHEGPAQRGAQRVYSDAAIEVALIVRTVYKLAFRQTEGFVDSLLNLLQPGLKCPHYSVICRRQAVLKPVLDKMPKAGKINLVLDSTGLKVYGDGEWKVRKHGASKRRTWRKLHVAIDPTTTEVHAVTLTDNGVHDCQEIEPLLEQVEPEVEHVIADGAYDKQKVFQALEKRGILPKIPPQHNALLSKPARLGKGHKPRDLAIEGCKQMGRKEWKESVGYHQRSKVETFMYRYKQIIGDKLRARKTTNQITEVTIACTVLNKMVAFGMPISVKIT
jgi:IS5 family transposase